jgi:hypothetical protein
MRIEFVIPVGRFEDAHREAIFTALKEAGFDRETTEIAVAAARQNHEPLLDFAMSPSQFSVFLVQRAHFGGQNMFAELQAKIVPDDETEAPRPIIMPGRAQAMIDLRAIVEAASSPKNGSWIRKNAEALENIKALAESGVKHLEEATAGMLLYARKHPPKPKPNLEPSYRAWMRIVTKCQEIIEGRSRFDGQPITHRDPVKLLSYFSYIKSIANNGLPSWRSRHPESAAYTEPFTPRPLPIPIPYGRGPEGRLVWTSVTGEEHFSGGQKYTVATKHPGLDTIKNYIKVGCDKPDCEEYDWTDSVLSASAFSRDQAAAWLEKLKPLYSKEIQWSLDAFGG